ncbi:MAG: hypothetical protein KDK65_06320 [Chlamydiia bacterium]|nr:hypothetical protein [Chlamydiia bacterium]
MSTHTFPIHIHYHRCPDCGKILENRHDWDYRLGYYLKDLTCSYCHHSWTEEKGGHFRLGPLFTQPKTAAFDWSRK